MFRKSRIKIVALLMAILVLTLLGTIAVIYSVSYREMSQENREMLELYSREYLQNGGLPDTDDEEEEQEPDEGEQTNESEPDEGEKPNKAGLDAGEPDEDPTVDREVTQTNEFPEISRRRLALSTFYSVVFSADGEVLVVNNDDPSQMSDEALTDLARKFLDSGKYYGISRNMIYLITGEDYTLISMMDNTLVGESILTLLRYTLIFGFAAIIVVLVLSIFLSGWIIRPLEDNYTRQNQFISDAGHELKTPVSTISTNAELLQREIGANRWLENIRYENGRMMEIVRNLLDLLRAESTQPQMEQVDLGRLVTAGTLPFEGKAFEQGFTLDCMIAEDVFIMGEASSLEKLISILIDNAFTHTKPSGRILVQLQGGSGTSVAYTGQGAGLLKKLHHGQRYANGKRVAVLTVSNEGDPIPPEAMDRIFDRFYRVDSSRTVSDHEETAHYGLGLSIAKAIATSHGGKISVSCDGGMTSFRVVFKG